eukprot:GEMP01041463.1.p1 GENE.GEMP01041463.1~~GEMP01041463.1.p1  ORF type:complete len:208 (+),score=59.30 GEMP01041463.1:251-874(+)
MGAIFACCVERKGDDVLVTIAAHSQVHQEQQQYVEKPGLADHEEHVGEATTTRLGALVDLRVACQQEEVGAEKLRIQTLRTQVDLRAADAGPCDVVKVLPNPCIDNGDGMGRKTEARWEDDGEKSPSHMVTARRRQRSQRWNASAKNTDHSVPCALRILQPHIESQLRLKQERELWTKVAKSQAEVAYRRSEMLRRIYDRVFPCARK